MAKIKPSPFILNLLTTTGASVTSVLANIVVMHLFASGLGAEKFGAYSLANRLIAAILPFSTLGVGSGLARYASLHTDDQSRYGYLLSAVYVGVIPSAAFLLFGFGFSEKLTVLLFRTKGYNALFVTVLFLAAGFLFFSILNGFYFGIGKIAEANIWQVMIGTIGPLAIAFSCYRAGNVELILFLTGLLYFGASVPLFFYLLRGVCLTKGKIGNRAWDLLRYCSPRMLAGIALAGLLGSGPFLAPYFGSLKDAGYLAVGQSLFRIAELGTGAFGLVALPKIGQLLSEKRHEFLDDRIVDLFAFIFHLGLFMTLHLVLWSDQIVLVWLGAEYAGAIPLMQVLGLAIGPYLAYVMLRPVIDAVEERAVNTRNLFIAFLISAVSSFFLGRVFGTVGLAIGTALGLSILGFLSLGYLFKSAHLHARSLQFIKVIVLNAGLIMAAMALKNRLVQSTSGIQLILSGGVAELFLLSVYFFSLRKLNFRWTVELEKRLIGYKTNG